MVSTISRVFVVLSFVSACASVEAVHGDATPAAPAWTAGRKQSVERRDDRRLLVGVACVADPALKSPTLRASLAKSRAQGEAAALDDQLVSAIMDGYETETLAAEMRKVAAVVEGSAAFTACAETWVAEDRACCRVEVDLQRDLLDRLAPQGIDGPLAEQVRGRAASAFDALVVD